MTEPLHNLLEQYFDTAFAAPDGIKKLRELILTLAMQGKLVAQDPNDPPARELLKQIEAEKQQLVKSGKIKQPKPLSPIKPEGIPYEIPQGWEWVRLSELGITQTGATPPSKDRENYGDFIPFIGPGNIKNGTIDYSGEGLSEQGLSKGRLIDANSVLMVCIGGSIGKHAINKRNVTCNQQINTLTPYSSIPVKYIFDIMATIYFQNALINQAGGSATPIINKQKWSVIPIPLPPLPEQHRIVAKIDQLMAKCDELEALRKAREEKRRAVHAAAIKQLLDTTSSFPRKRESSSSEELDLCSLSAREQTYGGDGVSVHGWNFIQQHFSELYTVKENVAELRKAILQLAVMGRLVPQDPNDPPASELLKQIEAEKQRLYASSPRKNRGSSGVKDLDSRFRGNDGIKTKPLPSIKPEEVPYELPQRWEWVRFEEIVDISSGITKGRKFADRKIISIPYLRVANVQRGYLDLKEVKEIEIPAEEVTKYQLINGDLLITEGGDWDKVGRTCIWIEEIPLCGHQNHVFRARKVLIYQNERWLEKYLNSPISRDYFANASKQTTNLASINMSQLRCSPIPLPPLPEQHRIVAKIDQLMTLCDQLEQQIDAASTKQRELLDAVMSSVS